MKLTTLCYLIKEGQVLLAMKKRGFATGKINGPGGKIEPNETPEQACRREFLEETGCELLEIEARGVIEFRWEYHGEDWHQFCHIFVANDFAGEPQETEEMSPSWYPMDQLPFDKMWDDDPLWLPQVLAGGKVNKRFLFDANGKVIREDDSPEGSDDFQNGSL